MTGQRRFCPTEVFTTARAELLTRLEQALTELDVPRLSLAFFDRNGHFDYSRVLHTDPDLRFQKASIYEGLLGLTIRRGEIVIYPHSIDSKENYLEVDPRTKFEIAGPVLFQNTACAALFGDMFDDDGASFEDDEASLEDYEILRRRFRSVLDSLSDIVEDSRRNITAGQIREALEELRSNTSSLRGYVAIRDWDSSLITLEVGDNTVDFIDLSENEGVCGYVLQTGRAINIKNTKTPPMLIHNGEARFHYISSDPKIQSEYVAPFIDGDNVIGVLNLEATHENNFREHRRTAINDVCDSLLLAVKSFRRPLDVNTLGAEFVVGRAMQDNSAGFDSPSYQSRSRMNSDIANRVIEELRQVFTDAILHGPYTSEVQLSESQFSQIKWNGRHSAPQWEKLGKWFLCCDIRREGIRQSLIVVESESIFSTSAAVTISRLGRLAALRFANATRRHAQLSRNKMISDLVTSDIHDFIASAPDLACGLWDCDHATIFVALKVENGKTKLFPVSSTSNELIYTTSDRSYTVDQWDGLTGFAATKKKPYVIARFANNEDLSKLGKVPRVKAKIVEMSSELPQSFAAIPLLTNGELSYLLRLSKVLGNRSAGFSEEDYEVMTLIQSLFGLRMASASSQLKI